MPLIKATATGANYLQKTSTGADTPVVSGVQMYQKMNGSDGTSSNTVFTLNNPYLPSTNTLMVFVNGQKIEKVTSATDTTEFEETDTRTVTNKITFSITIREDLFMGLASINRRFQLNITQISLINNVLQNFRLIGGLWW